MKLIRRSGVNAVTKAKTLSSSRGENVIELVTGGSSSNRDEAQFDAQQLAKVVDLYGTLFQALQLGASDGTMTSQQVAVLCDQLLPLALRLNKTLSLVVKMVEPSGRSDEISSL